MALTFRDHCRRLGFVLGWLFCLSAAMASDVEQQYPHKPIKIVVPFSAGGGSDRFVRLIQKAMREESLLPQPLVVINVPGAGGSIGSRRVKGALPDGYTLLNLHEGVITAKYAGMTTYGPEAFLPVAATGSAGMVICVAGDSPHGNLESLMAAAVAEPDRVLFGANIGAPSYFVGRRLEAAVADSAFRYVQTGGGAKRFASLDGGHIDASAFSIAEYFQFKDAGLRALAFLGEERHPDAPEIATAREQGIEVVSSNLQFWWAPHGTDASKVERFADALEAAMRSPGVVEAMAELRIDPVVFRGEALLDEIERREAAIAAVGDVATDRLPNFLSPVLGALAVMGLIVAVQEWRRRRVEISRPTHAEEINLRRPVLVMAVTAAFVGVLQFVSVPFAGATLVFVPVLGVVWNRGDRRALPWLVLMGALLGMGCWLLFTKVFVIDLP